MKNENILLAEENPKERFALADALEGWGFKVDTALDGVDAVKKAKTGKYGLLISSYGLPGVDGISMLESVLEDNADTRIIFISSETSIENAVIAMKNGAFDFIIKPIDGAHLKSLVNYAFASTSQSNDAHAVTSSGGPDKRTVRGSERRSDSKEQGGADKQIVTGDTRMLNLLDKVKQVADSRASVLIRGESGTGKELFARFIHENSGRRNGPFVAVNCGALPETLLESELFGHEKGAFTGAITKKSGKFELADRGTILLDEITEMQYHLQAKLLRVIQEREVDRVGGASPIRVDVRIIATTNRDVKETIKKGEFREDLFYRLNVIPLSIPPLRERAGDIKVLVKHFVEKYNRLDGRSVKSVTTRAMDKLLSLPFGGNVRELENLIERAVLLCDGEKIDAGDLYLEESLFEPDSFVSPEVQPASELPIEPLKEVEKKVIFQALDHTKGNRTHAATILGISVRTLRNKLNEYNEQVEKA